MNCKFISFDYEINAIVKAILIIEIGSIISNDMAAAFIIKGNS